MSFSFELLDEQSLETFERWFSYKSPLYEYNPGKLIMPKEFSLLAPRILNAEIRKEDVWLVSYPRSGSTWCQEIVWLIGNNFDFQKARDVIQHLRTPMIEMDIYFGQNKEYCDQFGCDAVEYVNRLSTPRFIKTHLNYDFLPREIDKIKPKIIYVARNPKDTYCSSYDHFRMFYGLKGPFEDFAKYYLAGKVPIGCPINHHLGFWNRRKEPNILFLRYENMKMDIKGTVMKIADFLQKPISQEKLDEVCEYVSLERMRNNPSVNMEKYVKYCRKIGNDDGGKGFIGQGMVGSWKTRMSASLSREFDDWISKKTEGTDLRY